MGKKRVHGLDSDLPLSFVGSFRAIAVADVDISQLNNGDLMDGLTLATGENVFLGGQADKTEIGPYTVGANAGETVRHASFPEGGDDLFPGALVKIKEGTLYFGTWWFVETPGDIVLGTTAIDMEKVLGVDAFGRRTPDGFSDGDGGQQVAPLFRAPRYTRKRVAATLTAPGDSVTEHVEDFLYHTYTIVVAGIETDIVLGIEASSNDTDLGLISLAGDPANAVTGCVIDKEKATISANGTYHLRVQGQFEKMKVVFVSEDPSPSTATVTPTHRGGE